jgi:serine/threonine-protein kinase HipA
MASTAKVILWGKTLGAVAWNARRQVADFEYDPAFIQGGLPVSPLMLPLQPGVFSFPALNRDTFHGMPGLLADSLPDRWGNTLIRLWLQQQGRPENDLDPVERLLYQSSRAMGALEFEPALRGTPTGSAEALSVESLATVASQVLKAKGELKASLKGKHAAALTDIIRVGTSAGGNRAKAVIAWNPKTQEVRSGQLVLPKGFEPWILKFDEIGDTANGQPSSFGRIEYAYHLMALAAGIDMSECRLWEEGGRAHFMTRRFDRTLKGDKLHMLSLGALAHLAHNDAGLHRYEDLFDVALRLDLGYAAAAQLFRRMVFNILARNQDDHTRNFAFLMDPTGHWRLAPAYDLAYAYNPQGLWTSQHQLSVSGKRDGFVAEDLLVLAKRYGVKKAENHLKEVAKAVHGWTKYAGQAGIDNRTTERIKAVLRLGLVKT